MRDLLYYLIIALAIVGVVFLLNREAADTQPSYAEVYRLFVQGKVDYFSVGSDDTLMIRLKEADPQGNVQIYHKLASVDRFHEDLGDIINEQLEMGILRGFDYKAPFTPPWWLTLLPTLLLMSNTPE